MSRSRRLQRWRPISFARPQAENIISEECGFEPAVLKTKQLWVASSVNNAKIQLTYKNCYTISRSPLTWRWLIRSRFHVVSTVLNHDISGWCFWSAEAILHPFFAGASQLKIERCASDTGALRFAAKLFGRVLIHGAEASN